MFIRAVVLLAFLASAAAFMTSGRASSSSMQMLFGKKKAVPVPAPAPTKPAPKTATKAAAKPAPKPVTKAAPAPAPKKAAPAPKKAAPAPKKAAPAAVSSGSGFLGIVGSDVEAPAFDPLGLSAGRSSETIAWYRAAELKHARICMLAALGLSVQPAFHLPDPVFDSTAGYGVVTKLYEERPEAIWQILLALAAIETVSLFKNGQGSSGDLAWDPLNLKEKLGLNADSSKWETMQLRELKNGRLAMIGTSALLLQEAVTGYGPYEQLLKH